MVGAGIAGLAAARQLTDAGHDVVIIEARNRIGGRIHTSQQWGDASVDLGASWIHGTAGNPITDLALAAGANLSTTDDNLAEGYDVNGTAFTNAQWNRLAQLQSAVGSAVVEGQNANRDAPLFDTVVDGVDFDNLPPSDQRMVSYLLTETEQTYSGATADLSTYWFDSGSFFGGDEAIFLDGYRVITEHLAQGLQIELGQRVIHIDATGSGVTVMTDLGTFSGDQAIVTLPLGVLKSGDVQFLPGLPSAMQSAVETLQMGTLNKVYLRFPSAFWPTQLDWLQHLPANDGEWTNWLSLARHVNQPVLMAFNAAAFGTAIEAWSDAEIVDAGMARLRTLFGNGIPNPTDFQITRWNSDPFTRGSYSFMTVGSHPDMRDALAGNINGKVFFAGEATSREYASTVHGAYLSGLRAAGEIMGSSLFGDGFESGNTNAWSQTSLARLVR